jgi:hypothetical protein
MFHVLEHLPRPLSVLVNLRKTSKDSTRLILEVPILENGETNDINGFFSVQHMTHFSRSSLKNCLNQAGWQIDEWDEQPGYNGCRIIANPSRNRCEIEIDAQDVFSVQRYLAAWFRGLGEVELKLKDCGNAKRFIIWGAGLHTEFLYQTSSFFHANPAQQYLIVDSDKMKQGRSWRGIYITDPGELSGLDWADKKMIISSYGSQNGIELAAIKMGFPSESIVKLYNKVRVY